MPVLNFQARFAEIVRTGSKRQTIRARRKDFRNPKRGDRLYLYTGMRTKQCRKLGEARCLSVEGIQVLGDKPSGEYGVFTYDRNWPGRTTEKRHELLARNDGFESFDEMLDWFRKTHGLPFDGLLIRWGKVSEPAAEGVSDGVK